jgi:hypothetical protein
MDKIPESCPPVNARTLLALTLLEAEASLPRTIALQLGELLMAVAHYVLNRAYHRRREGVPKQLRREGRCCHCGPTRATVSAAMAFGRGIC